MHPKLTWKTSMLRKALSSRKSSKPSGQGTLMVTPKEPITCSGARVRARVRARAGPWRSLPHDQYDQGRSFMSSRF